MHQHPRESQKVSSSEKSDVRCKEIKVLDIWEGERSFFSEIIVSLTMIVKGARKRVLQVI
jgi:hypothetical protein